MCSAGPLPAVARIAVAGALGEENELGRGDVHITLSEKYHAGRQNLIDTLLLQKFAWR